MDINISLDQGKQFKKLQSKIRKDTVIKEAYTNKSKINSSNYMENVINSQTMDFVSLKEGFEGQPNVTTPVLSNLGVLQKQYDTLLNQLDLKEKAMIEGEKNYIDRTDKGKNKFLNKNIKLTDGTQGYVTGAGVVKWYGTDDVFNNTAGKNSCPSSKDTIPVNFGQTAEYQNNGATIPVDPNLLVGSYMLNGQSCGNEGKNVYVSQMIGNTTSTNIGCYYNTDNKAMMPGWNTDENFCKNMAIQGGYMYYGLGNYQADTQTGTCYLGKDKATVTQFGIAQNINTPVAIWSSNTQGKGVSFLTISTEGSLQLCATNGTVIYETTKDPTCTKSYSTSSKRDSKGNDIRRLTGTTLDTCKKTCYDNPQCAGFAMNTSTNSDCWIKSKISKTTNNNSRDLYTKLPTKSVMANCFFFLTLQADGNVCIYKGTSPQNNKGSGAIWCTMTNGKQQQVNNNWLSSKGKFGKSFLTTGQNLSLGEWIGSDDGKLQLILQQDGNLVLYTSTSSPSCVTNTKDNKTYGNKGVVSIYELPSSGIKDNLGKIGYVDDNSDLHEYPSSMIGNSDNYNIKQNTTFWPNDSKSIISKTNVSNVNDCQKACSSNNNCNGFIHETTSNVCALLNNSQSGMITPNAQGYTFGERKPKLLNDASCGLDYTEIDTNQWQNYNKGEQMMESSKCGYGSIRENQYQEMLDIKLSMLDVANKLVDELNKIITETNNNTQQVKDINWLKEQLNKYKVVQESLKDLRQPTVLTSTKESFLSMGDLQGMLNDSNINVLSYNYNYVLWTIFAIGLGLITLKHINKQN